MSIDRIFDAFNRRGVRYLLIGGMNFALRHEPILTYDVDLWICDSPDNRQNCELALAELDAEWGPTDETWVSVKELQPGWIQHQSMFCLTTPHGAVDVFLAVEGLKKWQDSWNRGIESTLSSGTVYRAICDEDMLRCQLAFANGPAKEVANCNFACPNPTSRKERFVTSAEKDAEEAKRNRCWDPQQKWQAFQAAIAFVDAQQSVPRNSRASCLARQAKHWQSQEMQDGRKP